MAVKVTATILFFAKSRELAGKKQCEEKLSQSTSYSRVKQEIVDLYPDLAQIADNIVLAVNQEYIDTEHPHAGFTLNEGDEVAVIPPISGG